MRITELSATNFLGISAAAIAPKQPIVFVAGGNGAGKTALHQAMKLALFDDLPRVSLKKESAALVRGGAPNGAVYVQLAHGGESFASAVKLPSRVRSLDPLNGASVYCIEPHTFTHLDNEARAKVILELSNVKMDSKAIVGRLVAHGVPQQIVDELSPLLILGFEKCAEHAKAQATERRGAWKQITGETYGSVKAETWRPPAQGEVPEAPASLDEAIKAHQEASTSYQRLLTRDIQHAEAVKQRAADHALAPKAAELRTKVTELKNTAEGAVAHSFPACPACGALLDISEGGIREARPSPPGAISPAVQAKAKAALGGLQKELAAAEAAAARLVLEIPPAPTEQEVLIAKDLVAEKADLLASITKQQADYAAAVFGQKTVDRQRDNALAQHRWVQGWEAAQVALSPGGIPSEMMKAALAPFRAALRKVGDSDHIRSWPMPELGEDGSITAWGRPYALLSKSEQLRVDALLAAAIAVQSGVRMIALDEADTLEPAARSELIGWLADLADDSLIEQAWIFATLKAPIAFGGDYPAEAHWIKAGAVE